MEKDFRLGHILFRKLIYLLLAMIGLMIIPLVFSMASDFPDALRKHYADRKMIYWQVRQITISPVFDEPETTAVEFYFEKPASLFIVTPRQRVFARGDTIWTYLVKQEQIQKRISEYILNPFDFIDSAQTFYKVMAAAKSQITLKSKDDMMEPDSLDLYFDQTGQISKIEYLDLNDNQVVFEIRAESFTKHIPNNNFLAKKPKGVEIIDLDE